MKQLIWKELRQHRLIPISGAALVAAIMLAWHQSNPSIPTTDMALVLWVLVVVAGLLPGSEAIAPEVGNNTLPFLLSLPLSRQNIWFGKVIGGLLITFATAGAGALAFWATLPLLFGRDHATFLAFPYEGSEIVLTLCYGYALSLWCSTFVDRTVSALALSVAGLGITGAYLHTMETSLRLPDDFGTALIAVATLSLMAGSYAGFQGGGAMRSSRRVFVGLGSLAGCLVLGVVTVIAGNAIRIRAFDITKVGRYEIRWLYVPGRTYKTISVDAGDIIVGQPVEFMIRLANGDAKAGAAALPLSARDSSYPVAGTTQSVIVPANSPLLTEQPGANHLLPGIKVRYIPQLPSGKDTETIKVLSSTGRIVGQVVIHANRQLETP